MRKQEGKENQKRYNVFLSYAREDLAHAQRLYDRLTSRDVQVWFDKRCLLPGQKWRPAIRAAIHESSYFLALVSSRSLSKRGFVQKELRVALDVLDEVPDSQIFLIPVRVDDCQIEDERLQTLHWVDLFPSFETGFERIVAALGVDLDFAYRLFDSRTYDMSFLRKRIRETLGERCRLKWDKKVDPPQLEIHIYHKETHRFPEVLRLSDWAEQYVLPEWNELRGPGQLELVEENSTEVTFSWCSDRLEPILALTKRQVDDELYRLRWYIPPGVTLMTFPQLDLLVYRAIELSGLDKLIAQMKEHLGKELLAGGFRSSWESSVLLSVLKWIIFSVEKAVGRTFKPGKPPTGIPYNAKMYPLDYLGLHTSPSETFREKFSEVSIQPPFSEQQLVELLRRLEQWPLLVEAIKEIKHLMFTDRGQVTSEQKQHG